MEAPTFSPTRILGVIIHVHISCIDISSKVSHLAAMCCSQFLNKLQFSPAVMFDLDYTEVLRKFDDLLARKEILYGSTTTVNIIDQGFAVRRVEKMRTLF